MLYRPLTNNPKNFADKFDKYFPLWIQKFSICNIFGLLGFSQIF